MQNFDDDDDDDDIEENMIEYSMWHVWERISGLLGKKWKKETTWKT